MTLTDTQLVLLSAASQREDGAVVLAPNLKGGAAGKVVGKLLRDGLIEEVSAAASLPAWRRDDDAGPRALRITKLTAVMLGLAAIGVDVAHHRRPRKPSPPSSGQMAHPKGLPVRSLFDRKEVRARKPGRGQSKQAKVLALLQRSQGATIAASGTPSLLWRTASSGATAHTEVLPTSRGPLRGPPGAARASLASGLISTGCGMSIASGQ
jgi:hypothetical protein